MDPNNCIQPIQECKSISMTENDVDWAVLESIFPENALKPTSSVEMSADDNTTDNFIDELDPEFDFWDDMQVLTAEEVDEELGNYDGLLAHQQLVLTDDAPSAVPTVGDHAAFESAPLPDDKTRVKDCGWTDYDNQALQSIVRGQLAKVRGKLSKLNWDQITATLNELRGQNRSKVQVYSHFRNYTVNKRRPCYTQAEEEVIRALAEKGMPCKDIARFMAHDRNEGQITQKLAKLTSVPYPYQPEDEEYKRRTKFRQRVKNVVFIEGGLMVDSSAITPELIERVRFLMTMDPYLIKNSHPIGVGRPKKPSLENGLSNNAYEELAFLLRPFTYVNNRRKRKTSLAGDGRRYGANLFALYRLLGCPFNLDKMPKDKDDAMAAGIKEVDIESYAVLRQAMESFDAAKMQKDREFFNQDAETLPSECLLPPTLFTMTGMRGLFLYYENLKAMANKNNGDEPQLKRPKTELNKTDEAIVKTMLALFFYPYVMPELVKDKYEGDENSDAASDSDEDCVWASEEVAALRDNLKGSIPEKNDVPKPEMQID